MFHRTNWVIACRRSLYPCQRDIQLLHQAIDPHSVWHHLFLQREYKRNRKKLEIQYYYI